VRAARAREWVNILARKVKIEYKELIFFYYLNYHIQKDFTLLLFFYDDK